MDSGKRFPHYEFENFSPTRISVFDRWSLRCSGNICHIVKALSESAGGSSVINSRMAAEGLRCLVRDFMRLDQNAREWLAVTLSANWLRMSGLEDASNALARG